MIYKITNKLNNKIYVGAHKTGNKDDGYFGSGLLIERAVSKHGQENFVKEILFELSGEEEMWQKEADIVDEEFVARDDTYNIKLGGCGGFDYINKNGLTNFGKPVEQARKAGRLGGLATHKRWLEDEEFKIALREKRMNNENFIRFLASGNSFKGRTHTDETKRKIGLKNSKLLKGKNNPSYGKHWITNGVISKLVPKDDVFPEGWKKGRV